MYLFKYQNRY